MITEQRADVLARTRAVIDLSNRLDTVRYERDADARAAVRALLRDELDRARRYAQRVAELDDAVERLMTELKAL